MVLALGKVCATDLLLMPASGHYEGGVHVTIEAPPGATVYVTMDGSTPNLRADRYQGPLTIRRNTMVRAIAVVNGQVLGEGGATYLIDEPESNLPTLSIGTEPNRLFHPRTGLFVDGPNARFSHPQRPGANYWSRERWPAYIDYWEPDGKTIFSNVTDVRLFGGVSRTFDQKSLSISAHRRHGVNRIGNYPLGRDGPKRVQHLVLRNAGSDFSRAHLRDLLTSRICREWPVFTQLGRSVRVYINGTYWGLYHLREKINPDFIADHYPVDSDSIDLLEHRLSVKHGTGSHYRRLLRYLEQHYLSDPVAYSYVAEQMDIESFMHHQIVQVFIDNRDAGGNIRFWRPQRDTGRWRWILFDTDYSYGLHDPKSYAFNTLALLTDPAGDQWPNPPWSTFLFRKLLEQPHFRERFLQRFADALNTVFRTERIVRQLDSLVYHIEPEMQRHLERWKLPRSFWYQQLDRIRTFAHRRPVEVQDHLSSYFGLDGWVPLRLQPTDGGYVQINGGTPVYEEGLAGYYPSEIPLTIRAHSNYGYHFSGWEGAVSESDPETLLLYPIPNRPLVIRARFEPLRGSLPDAIQISEICPHHSQTGDWLELHHAGTDPVNLAGWELRDDRHRYVLPAHRLLPGDYLVVARKPEAIQEVHPQLHSIVGPLSFGLQRESDQVSLVRPDGQVVSTRTYRFDGPGTDFVYTRDRRGRWRTQAGLGTPGAPPSGGWLDARDATLTKRLRLIVGFALIVTAMLWYRSRHQQLTRYSDSTARRRLR